MGAGVAFQQPVILRPTMQAPRAPSGAPAPSPTFKPVTIAIPGAPKVTIPSPVMPRPTVTGTRTQLPIPTRPAPIPQPHFLTPGGTTQVSTTGVLTAPVQGPGIPPTTDQGFVPPPPPTITGGGGGGGGGGDGSGGNAGAGGSPASGRPFPWLILVLVAGGLYLVTS